MMVPPLVLVTTTTTHHTTGSASSSAALRRGRKKRKNNTKGAGTDTTSEPVEVLTPPATPIPGEVPPVEQTAFAEETTVEQVN